jgi:hypothetical protein
VAVDPVRGFTCPVAAEHFGFDRYADLAQDSLVTFERTSLRGTTFGVLTREFVNDLILGEFP